MGEATYEVLINTGSMIAVQSVVVVQFSMCLKSIWASQSTTTKDTSPNSCEVPLANLALFKTLHNSRVKLDLVHISETGLMNVCDAYTEALLVNMVQF